MESTSSGGATDNHGDKLFCEIKPIGSEIRAILRQKDGEYLAAQQSINAFLLGDWRSEEDKHRLFALKAELRRAGLYTETIDEYYDPEKGDGLTEVQILATACEKNHIIIFINGTGPGTITEQNFLRQHPEYEHKVIFYIKKEDFDKINLADIHAFF